MFRLAVYGTLRRGYGNDKRLAEAEYVGLFVVKNHEMWSTGAFPYIHYHPCRTVVVEVYNINEKQFISCDSLEGYPTHYQRKVVPYFKTKKDNKAEGLSWIYYVAHGPTRQADVIESGDWESYVVQREVERQEAEARRKSTAGKVGGGFRNYAEYGYCEYDPTVGRSVYVPYKDRRILPAKT